MSTDADRVREQQRAIWDTFSAGWNKWDKEVMDWHAPFGDAMIRRAALRPDSRVLDVAAGTGEPGLSAAALVPDGSVVLTDLSEGMLAVARSKATARGLANVRTQVADAAALPFDDGSFDAVLCRFGFMFFPDIAAVIGEMSRVSRPGARICAAVWGPPAKNPWATTVLGTIGRHLQQPVLALGAPGLFRCSGSGFMDEVFIDGGLLDVSEHEVTAELVHQSPEAYWDFMTDIAAPVMAGLAKADEVSRERIRTAVLQLARKHQHNGGVRFGSSATIAVGTRS
jgi:ubiquinone/menaquinone biosynthesis C-methylase UbiE